MRVERFYDNGLAHASYAVLSEDEIALIDPARDPNPYYKFAQENNAKITAVIETHLHADFVSSHLEISKKTSCPIYVNRIAEVEYPHRSVDENTLIPIGKVKLKVIDTPGHSPDSISVLLLDEKGKENLLFSGDTLFIGDIGRPDLRENDGSNTKEELADMLYASLHERLLKLSDDVLVYPAHGAGSLCGKNLSTDPFSSIGREKKENYALQPMTEDLFRSMILKDLPYTPKYFKKCVQINKIGAEEFEKSIKDIPRVKNTERLQESILIIDTRPSELFKTGHLNGAINIQDGTKFETWLGSIVGPEEPFYLIAETEKHFDSLIRKIAKIGYEKNIKGILANPSYATLHSDKLNEEEFSHHLEDFTIVDVRNKSERAEQNIFKNSINIPLPELRERIKEISLGKPIVVHCAAGYRSAAASSILEQFISTKVFDLGEKITEYKK